MPFLLRAPVPSHRRARGRHRRRRSVLRPTLAATGALAVTAGAELAGVVPSHAATADDFLRLRVCESGDNYAINTGNGYYGAYQFSLPTWRDLGLSGLPSDASPAVQDEAARRLQAQRGWAPWPACSRRLGLGEDRASRSDTRAPLPAKPAPSSAPAPSKSAKAFHRMKAPTWGGRLFRTSMVGHHSADVARWQARMVQRGWHLTVDGYYGPRSAAVCTAFERALGLHVESPGIVGPQVWTAAFEAPQH